MCAYRREVDYKGSTMLYSTMLFCTDVTHAIYHQSGMQGASTINLSLSTTLTLKINTLLPLEQEKSPKRVVNLMNNINKMLT